MFFGYAILALAATSCLAAELRGSHDLMLERELLSCENTADYGAMDKGCNNKDLPVCVSSTERYIPANNKGTLCRRCVNSYAVDGPPPMYWPDFDCPDDAPKCLKADYTEPKVWFAGMFCVDGDAPCYNSATLPAKDYKCTTSEPICVYEDGTEPALNNPGDKCVAQTWTWSVYTTDKDFHNNNTVMVNVDTHTADQLDLESKGTTYNFLWVPESNLGTVVKINIDTGTIVGRYKTWPDSYGVGSGSPSRTTVDNDGSLWLSNRIDHAGHGTITHIGLEENGQCEDRNKNGKIDTSTSLGDLKGWADDTGTRGVAKADDECIVHFVAVSSTGTRHVSVTQDNNVWVSGSGARNFDLVKGGRYDVAGSGTIIKNYPSVGWGGYGGLVDGNGVVWSSLYGKGLMRWDPALPLSGTNGAPGGPSGLDIGPPKSGTTWGGNNDYYSYGVCVDSSGNVWNADIWGGQIRKYAFDGKLVASFSTGGDRPRGCVVNQATGDVWIANSGSDTVTHLKNDGTFLGKVTVGDQPTGVAIDRSGKIWACNLGSHTVMRIDPASHSVDLTINLTPGAGPYTYSDMTGSTLTAPPSTGTWTVTHDSGVVGQKWGYVNWTASTPSDSKLTVQACSSTDGINCSAWESVTKLVDLTVPDGRYLHVRVTFSRATTTPYDTPILYDVSISPSI